MALFESCAGCDYSTTEQKTGAHWIDGKPIYRKVIDWGDMPSNTTAVSKPHGITNMLDVVKIFGIYKTSLQPSNPQYGCIPIVNPTPEYQTGVWINRTDLTLRSGDNRSNYRAWIVIEYTKTTD